MKLRKFALALLLGIVPMAASCAGGTSSGQPSSLFPSEEERDSDNFVISNGVVTTYLGNAKRVKIPETYEGKTVVGIGENAFEEAGIEEISLPETLTTIRSNAFLNCTSLKSINLPDALTSIGAGAFAGCTSLTSIVVPKGITEIAKQAFDGCTALKSVSILGKTTAIGDSAFHDCRVLESFVIPDGTKTIGEKAFHHCLAIKSITIPKSVTSIGNSAFHSCNHLTSIELPDGITTIQQATFAYCYELPSIVIPESVSYIGNNAFYKCYAMKSANIPNTVREISYLAFAVCTAIEDIFIPKSVKDVGSCAFQSCYNLSIRCERGEFDSYYYWARDWNPTNCPVTWNCEAEPSSSSEQSSSESSAASSSPSSSATSKGESAAPYGPQGSRKVPWYLVGVGECFTDWTIEGGLQLWENPNNPEDKGCALNVTFAVGDTFKVTDGDMILWFGYENVDPYEDPANAGLTCFEGVDDGWGGENFSCTVAGIYDMYVNKNGVFWIQVHA